MNKYCFTYRLLIFLALVLTGVFNLYSQDSYDTSYNSVAERIKEGVTMFTDRDMYAVNERIYFRALHSTPLSSKQPWSKVLYLELVTPDGEAVANGKYHIDGKGSSGYLSIPPDILTGNYFLRSYTRWMRNFGPLNYCYLPLKIINPNREELLSQSLGKFTDLPERPELQLPGLACRTNKEIYSPGEEVLLEIPSPEKGQASAREYCLTIVQAGLIDTMCQPVMRSEGNADADFTFYHLPDIRGVSISGSVVNSEDRSASVGSRIHFSILGENPDYFAATTDMQGRFVLTVPERTSLQEMFVVSEAAGGQKREILIDQDFATDPVPIGSKAFSLTSEEREAASRMVLNMQLSKAYGPAEVNSSPVKDRDSEVRFYGTADIVVEIGDYVKLPTMGEVFLNLVPNVFVHYKRKEPYIKIESLNSSISLFKPLILLDGIPVFDLKALLQVNPIDIKQVAVINEVYIKGDHMYGGIIDITSVNNDMAVIDLPEGSYFFDFQTYYPGDLHAPLMDLSFEQADSSKSNTAETGDRIPDSRNTIKWIPSISPDPDNRINLQFSSPNTPGDYLILIRGVSPSGEFVYGMINFLVERN